MVGSSITRLALVIGCTLTLAACEEFPGLGGEEASAPDAANAPAAALAPQAERRVVEAPEVFDVTDTALWDGRPSLGLVWVAYEGVDPQNVIIRNTSNGEFVIGALYRRERFFPGPPFQLSSDAAAELGILAGQPTEVQVIALKEEIIEPELPPAVAGEVAEDGLDEELIAAVPGAIIPAAEAVDAVETAALDPVAAAAAAAIDAVDPVAGAVPRRPTVEGPNAPLTAATAAVATPSAAPVPTTVAAAPRATPRANASSLERPFIQVGIFSVEANAERTAQLLGSEGIIPLVDEQSIGDKTFYRVVVGPASDSAERATLLQQVKGQGFTDAYFVAN